MYSPHPEGEKKGRLCLERLSSPRSCVGSTKFIPDDGHAYNHTDKANEKCTDLDHTVWNTFICPSQQIDYRLHICKCRSPSDLQTTFHIKITWTTFTGIRIKWVCTPTDICLRHLSYPGVNESAILPMIILINLRYQGEGGQMNVSHAVSWFTSKRLFSTWRQIPARNITRLVR